MKELSTVEFPLNVFKRLEQATKIDELETILDDSGVETKYRIKKHLYPKIQFAISTEELEELKRKKLISELGDITRIHEQDALTKLLYAMAWKNGDLKKLHHIISGIEADGDHEQPGAVVFHQFGKHLRDKNEPIIDQHVIRAFGIYLALDCEPVDQIEIARLKKLRSLTKKDNFIIRQYKVWLQQKLTPKLRAQRDYAYHVDHVLFAIGKKLRS